MGSERLGKFLFELQHFCGFVGIFFAADIAADPEAAIKSRSRRESVCLPKGDSMPKKNILSNMKPMVLAAYHPAIMAVLPYIIFRQQFCHCFSHTTRDLGLVWFFFPPPPREKETVCSELFPGVSAFSRADR